MSVTLTSPKMQPTDCETVLMCMFDFDKDNAWNLRELAYNSAGTWVGDVVSVKCTPEDRMYVIRYRSPATTHSASMSISGS